jgi:UDP-glucose 6-dehydrogenase
VSEREPIAVIGVGYVGLVTAAGFAELGSEVWCVDIDPDRIAGLRRGEMPIYEPGVEETLAAHRERIHFGTELAPALEHARLLFVAVGTPSTYSGDADLSAVYAVVESMPPSGRHALVMKSTVPCGTGAHIQRTLEGHGKGEFGYVSCPEFLREGTALADFRKPDRIVIGDDGGWAGNAVIGLYEPLGAPVLRMDVPSAEMVKLASNAFLSTKISFINEIANVCEETGADVAEVARGMGLDERIGPSFLRPGIGYGGSCLVGEETVLARLHGRTTLMRFDELWRRLEADGEEVEDGVLFPERLEVLSWIPGAAEPTFMPVMAVTRRDYQGEVVEVGTELGRPVTCTPDHPWIVKDARGKQTGTRLADQLTRGDWIPVSHRSGDEPDRSSLTPRSLGDERPPTQTSRPDDVGFRATTISPTRIEHRTQVGRAGHRTRDRVSWIAVVSVGRRAFEGPVYSLEVPLAHTFATTHRILVHNCFPKDVSALKQLAGNTGYHFQLLNAVIEVNELQKRRVVAKLQKHLGTLVGKRVALLGLAFKPDTDDMREASSLVLSARLQAEGATVRAYDPVAEEQARGLMPKVELAPDALEALRDADAAVLVTEWAEFLELDWAAVADRMAGRLIVDGRNALDPAAVRAAGLTYEGIGRR